MLVSFFVVHFHVSRFCDEYYIARPFVVTDVSTSRLSECLAYTYGTIVKYFALVPTPDVYQSKAFLTAATMLISHPLAGQYFPPEIPRYIDKAVI